MKEAYRFERDVPEHGALADPCVHALINHLEAG
jgi:hypothetical protein